MVTYRYNFLTYQIKYKVDRIVEQLNMNHMSYNLDCDMRDDL